MLPILPLLSVLPWKRLIGPVAIGLALLAVGLYIKNAEDNRSAVSVLKMQNAELVKTNEENIRLLEQDIRVLENTLVQERERERDYAENIRVISEGPDGSCAASSAAITNALRMRGELRTRNENRN